MRILDRKDCEELSKILSVCAKPWYTRLFKEQKMLWFIIVLQIGSGFWSIRTNRSFESTINHFMLAILTFGMAAHTAIAESYTDILKYWQRKCEIMEARWQEKNTSQV